MFPLGNLLGILQCTNKVMFQAAEYRCDLALLHGSIHYKAPPVGGQTYQAIEWAGADAGGPGYT